MQGFDFNTFWNTFDFNALMVFFNAGQYMQLLMNPLVLGGIALLLVLIALPKTREVATSAAGYLLVGLVYGVGGVVLKNSVISQPGPFIIFVILFFGAIGYVIWTKLLN